MSVEKAKGDHFILSVVAGTDANGSTRLQPPVREAVPSRLLAAEADAIAARIGKNAYSDFLRRHWKRPNVAEARSIGAYMGVPVTADDGSMQPTSAKRLQRRKRHRRRDIESKLDSYRALLLVHEAVSQLAAVKVSPADVLASTEQPIDPKIAMNTEIAVSWLLRFAQELNTRENKGRADSQKQA